MTIRRQRGGAAIAALAVCAVALAMTPALAQHRAAARSMNAKPSLAATARLCADQSVANVTQRIDACTTLLQSGIKDKPRAVALGLRGLAYLDRSDLAHAIPDFDNSIALASDDPSVFQNRGNAWYARGNFGRAAADYDEAIRLDPASPSAYANRGTLRRDLGNYAEALEDFDKAISLDGNRAGTYAARGELYLRQRDYERALADFDAAARIEPRRAATYLMRARTKERAGHPDRALADYAEAARLDPQNIEALTAQAAIHRRAGHPDRAIALYDQALGIDQRMASLYRLRAEALADKGERKRAIEDVNRSLKFDWTYDTIQVRGLLRLREGEIRGALSDANMILKNRPDDSAALALRGAALRRGKDIAQALASLDQAIAHDERNAFAYAERARARLAKFPAKSPAKSDTERALPDLDRAITLGATDTDLYRERGLILAARKDYAKAVDDLSMVVKRDPQDVAILYQRALALRALGQAERALADYDAVIAREPANRAALIERAKLRTDHGEVNGAIEDYAAAIALKPDAALSRERAALLMLRKDFAKAAEELDQAIRLDPRSAAAYAMRARTREELQDKAEALADYRKALQREPNDDELRQAVARLNDELHPRKPAKTAKADKTAKAERTPKQPDVTGSTAPARPAREAGRVGGSKDTHEAGASRRRDTAAATPRKPAAIPDRPHNGVRTGNRSVANTAVKTTARAGARAAPPRVVVITRPPPHPTVQRAAPRGPRAGDSNERRWKELTAQRRSPVQQRQVRQVRPPRFSDAFPDRVFRR